MSNTLNLCPALSCCICRIIWENGTSPAQIQRSVCRIVGRHPIAWSQFRWLRISTSPVAKSGSATPWDSSPAHLKQIQIKFDKLWEGREKDWIAVPVPEAVKLELLKYRTSKPPVGDVGEPKPEDEQPQIKPHIDTTQKERIVFQFLRDAPPLLNSHRLGVATSTVQPWPHQIRVSDAIVERFPHSFMLCDEVGLGKTVEAGMAIRQLLLSGRVQRALILIPKSVLVQWQEELYEKFILNIPRYDGSSFYDVFNRELKVPSGTNPWDAHPVFLTSSHLAKRRERRGHDR